MTSIEFDELVHIEATLLVHWVRGKPKLVNRAALEVEGGYTPATFEALYQTYLTAKAGEGRKSIFSLRERREISANGKR